MSYKLYDITLYYSAETHKEKEFTIRQNLVSDLYVSFLNNYKQKGTTRVSVTLKNEDHIVGYHGSILSVYAYFNEAAYWSTSAIEQNQIILDTVHRIAILCADKYNWDKTVFQDAYLKVIASGFIYKQEQKRKLSRDKKHQAALLLQKNGAITIISVQFYDEKSNLIRSTELFRSFHADWFYSGIIKNNKWFNNREFGVYARKEELIIKASLYDLSAEIIITPGIHTREDIERLFRRISYSELDRPEYLKWIEGE